MQHVCTIGDALLVLCTQHYRVRAIDIFLELGIDLLKLWARRPRLVAP
jgi:hypothetical protein